MVVVEMGLMYEKGKEEEKDGGMGMQGRGRGEGGGWRTKAVGSTGTCMGSRGSVGGKVRAPTRRTRSVPDDGGKRACPRCRIGMCG